MEKQSLNKNNESGFILVTSIILLAILMGLGAAAMFKSQIEIKVSASAADTAKAFSAAQAGLDYTYNYWSQDPYGGQAEFAAIAAAVTSSGTTGANILNDMYAETMSDIGVTAADVDTWVQGSNARVYNLTGANMQSTTNANWGQDTYAQVAVWTARFKPSATDYPYATPMSTSATCSDCTAVTYVLGRSHNAYKLVREYAFISNENVQAFGAMMNAPRYNSDANSCGTPTPAPSTSTTTNTGGPSGSAITGSHLIDATQAPGGIGIASNNGVDLNAGKNFYSNTGSSFKDIDPYVIFDPGKVAATTATYPEVAGGLISGVTSAISADRFDPSSTGGYMNIFNSDSDQLFQLNAYREAANRISGFANETLYGTFPGGATSYTVDSAGTTLGNYNAATPTMGTMQWPDVVANIQASRPMYGIVRFMIPVVDSTNRMTVCSANDTILFDRGSGFTNSLAGGTGKLIVYGGALFDFFFDGYTGIDPSNTANGTYEPSKDRLLTPMEAAQDSFKMNVDIPLMFNPVMDTPPRTVGGAMDTFAGESILDITAYPIGSPSWDLASDKNVGDGAMDYIQDIYDIASNWSTRVYDNVNAALQFTAYADWITNNKPTAIGGAYPAGREAEMLKMLDYYIRTTAEGTNTNWSHKKVSDIEAHSAFFQITTVNDLANAPSAADIYHSFLPSGYTHGWKRAMVVTGLAAQSGGTGKSIWNEELIGNNAGFVSPYYSTRNKYFNLNGYQGGPNGARVDRSFADIPAEMYAGGLVDMHQIVNTSGVVYTPGQLELEQKKKNGFEALQYINGLIITGHGTFMKQESAAPNALTVIAYDDTSIDNLPSNQATINLGRKYWQELK